MTGRHALAVVPLVFAVTSAPGAAQHRAPSDVHLVALDPGHASLAWSPVRGAAGYLVTRVDCGAVTPQPITTTAFEHRTLLRRGVAYAYIVLALYPDGDRVMSSPMTLKGPMPRRPNVTATRLRDERVRLIWDDAATGAAYHLIEGAGIAGTDGGRTVAWLRVPTRPGEKVQSVDTNRLPPGPAAWTVTPIWMAPGEATELRDANAAGHAALVTGQMMSAVP